MDNTEIHYLTYDPEKIFQEMNLAYIQAGGDILYPGDEKEMLLRGVQAMIVQVFAGVDAALRMDTLRYAVGDYLDIYGEKRNCVRLGRQLGQRTGEDHLQSGRHHTNDCGWHGADGGRRADLSAG